MHIARVGRLCLTVVLTVTLTTGSDANDGGIEVTHYVFLDENKDDECFDCHRVGMEPLSQCTAARTDTIESSTQRCQSIVNHRHCVFDVQ